jgi:hypothetical protein
LRIPSFANELEDQKDFPKALCLQMAAANVLYTVFSAVVYSFVGVSIQGLALDSAPVVPSKVAFGIGSVTIVMGGVVNAHILAKFVYILLFPIYAKSKSWTAYLVWYAILAVLWAFAFVLGICIPSFQHILSLLGALFQCFISFGLPALMWWKMQEPDTFFNTKKRALLTIFHIGLVLLGFTLMVLGMYSVGVEIKSGNSGKVISCQGNLDVLDYMGRVEPPPV